jgi:hypothetical protein
MTEKFVTTQFQNAVLRGFSGGKLEGLVSTQSTAVLREFAHAELGGTCKTLYNIRTDYLPLVTVSHTFLQGN